MWCARYNGGILCRVASIYVIGFRRSEKFIAFSKCSHGQQAKKKSWSAFLSVYPVLSISFLNEENEKRRFDSITERLTFPLTIFDIVFIWFTRSSMLCVLCSRWCINTINLVSWPFQQQKKPPFRIRLMKTRIFFRSCFHEIIPRVMNAARIYSNHCGTYIHIWHTYILYITIPEPV